MERTKLLAYIDILAFAAFSVSLFSGIVLWQILPSGSGPRGEISAAKDTAYLGFQRHEWNDMHVISSIVMSLIVLYHLALHLKWIKNVPKIINS